MKKIVPLVFLLLIMMTACIGPFYEADHGKNIALPIGTPFEVRLEGNPDSPFVWKVNDLDTNVVRMVLRPAFKAYSDSARTGGVYSFYFQTVGEGKTQIRMIYANREQDKENYSPVKSFEMEVESRI